MMKSISACFSARGLKLMVTDLPASETEEGEMTGVSAERSEVKVPVISVRFEVKTNLLAPAGTSFRRMRIAPPRCLKETSAGSEYCIQTVS